MIHLGKLIREELAAQERTPAWLARKLFCDRSNVYKLLKKQNLDTELLRRISVILQHDFFSDCSERMHLPSETENESEQHR